MHPQFQAAADDGQQEAFGLARASAGGHQRRLAGADGAEGLLLVPVGRRVRRQLLDVRGAAPFLHQLLSVAPCWKVRDSEMKGPFINGVLRVCSRLRSPRICWYRPASANA